MARRTLEIQDLRSLIDDKVGRSRLTVIEAASAQAATITHPRRSDTAVELDLVALAESAADDTPATPRVWVASFLEGVDAALSAPPLPEDAAFSDLAGGLVPRLDGPGFAAGLEAAGSSAPYQAAWLDGLFLTYWIELDMGVLPLTQELVAEWGATDDRVRSAARSLLFHKSRRHEPEPLEDGPVLRWRAGDGYDTARVLVAADRFWDRPREGVWAGVPCDGELLLAFESEALPELARLTRGAYERAGYPLSPHAYDIAGPTPERVVDGSS